MNLQKRVLLVSILMASLAIPFGIQASFAGIPWQPGNCWTEPWCDAYWSDCYEWCSSEDPETAPQCYTVCDGDWDQCCL